MDFPTFEKSKWFDMYVGQQNINLHWLLIQMCWTEQAPTYKLFNFTGIKMEVTNAVINTE